MSILSFLVMYDIGLIRLDSDGILPLKNRFKNLYRKENNSLFIIEIIILYFNAWNNYW